MWSIAMLLSQVGEMGTMSEGISAGALVFMLVSMGSVIVLTVWCFVRILRTKEHFDPDGTGPARPPVPGEEGGGAA